MKKVVILLVSVLVVISMVLMGCAPEAAPPPEEEEEEAAPEEEEEEEAPPAAPEEEVFEITWQDTDPPAQSQWYALQNLADRVRAASGGRLDITVLPEGQVVPRNECTPAVKDGVVQIATIPTSIDTGRLGPVTYLMVCSGLPAGPSTIECIAWLYQGGGLELINDLYADWAYVIGASAGAAELFCHSNEPLETAADFKGLKFRTFGMWAEVLGGYGAVVTMLPGAELYSGVERGVIDAFVGFLELVSEMVRLISFTFRLFGNMFAGEVVILMFTFLIPLVLTLPFYGLELFVGLIQAFIFAALTLVFGMIAVAHGNHAGAEEAEAGTHQAETAEGQLIVNPEQ